MTEQWTCDDCGLVHSHHRGRHTLFNGVDWDLVKKLDWNPDCNCGAYEADHRGFHENGAMVPDHVANAIEQGLGPDSL